MGWATHDGAGGRDLYKVDCHWHSGNGGGHSGTIGFDYAARVPYMLQMGNFHFGRIAADWIDRLLGVTVAERGR